MIDIYTDGSCSGNPGPGGWAAIVVDGATKTPHSGGESKTTNNRMEMTGVIKGLASLPAGTSATVHSDSQYVVYTMTKGWKRKLNTDLWTQLDAVVAERDVHWKWVRGHNGHPQNEEADRLAVAAMLKFHPGKLPSDVPSGAAPDADEAQLTHLDDQGNARMVDVTGKPDSVRDATAAGNIKMRPETLALILEGKVEKGDVFTVARIAGINAAKHTWELIPLAHQIPLGQVSVDFKPEPATGAVIVTASARTTAKTGVEMEALTAVSVAALTIYDMCKAVDRGMTIGAVRLLTKTGGTHGDYTASS
ncbi:MAG: cyclic pyranopterin monophosphate synthase MoaC [Dehalococcoidia bacterium]